MEDFEETITIKLDEERQMTLLEFIPMDCHEQVLVLINAWINEAFIQGQKKGKLRGMQKRREGE